MKRRIFIFGIVALIVSLAASSLWAPSYEESLLKVELQEQGLLSERVADAPTAHQQLLARHGMKAFLAAEQYPEMAPALYALYEQVEYEGKPLLTTVIDANGYERVVPAVWYFVQNPKTFPRLSVKTSRNVCSRSAKLFLLPSKG
jgi:hypothetical protein